MPYSTRQICIPDHDEPRLGSELPVLSLAPNGVHSCASGGQVLLATKPRRRIGKGIETISRNLRADTA
jgi:hypothetical protein